MENNIRGAVNTLKTHKYVNVVPSKEDVDYDATYYYTDPALVHKTFKFLDGNRLKIDPKHVKELRDAYLDPVYGPYVDSGRVDINTMAITDMQHRVYGWLKAYEINPDIPPLRVRFEDYPKDKMIDIIQKINCGAKPWGIHDFENYLETIGDISIINTKEFGESHRLLAKFNKKGEVVGYYPRYVYAILLGKNATKDVKNGTFEVTSHDLQFGEKIYKEIERMIDETGLVIGNWFEAFIFAWYDIRSSDFGYNDILDRMGMEKFYANIAKCWEGMQVTTKKGIWERRMRDAIYHISTNC